MQIDHLHILLAYIATYIKPVSWFVLAELCHCLECADRFYAKSSCLYRPLEFLNAAIQKSFMFKIC